MPATIRAGNPHQQIRFCRAPDGVRIAYAVHGDGPPMLISTCWLTHLQHDWESPVWRHFLSDIGEFATVIRFDERGHGLSDWDVTDFSLEARLGDLAAVADDAGFETFALMAMAQGGPVAISYAHRHPQRVTRLIFYDSYANPLHGATDEDIELEDAFEHIIKVGWGRPEGTFRRVFSTQMIPDATEEQLGWLDDLLKVSVSPRTAVLARQQRKWTDASALMPELSAPTLVLHSLRDRMSNFEHARHLTTNHSRRPAGTDGQRQPHPARRRAGLAGVRRRGSRLPRRRPQGSLGTRENPFVAGSVEPRARGADAGRGRSGQRRDRPHSSR